MSRIGNNRNHTSPHGITLVELLIYLGLSALVSVGLMGFMVRTAAQRSALANQQQAQRESRLLLERMSLALRNAYAVEISADGERIAIQSYDYGEVSQTMFTVFEKKDQSVYMGQRLNEIPTEEDLICFTSSEINVQQLQFLKVSSSVQFRTTMAADGHTASLSSTIAFRQ